MDKTDKYIDDLFHQKFSDAGVTIPPSDGDWLKLSKVIRKENFMRFSPDSFNVYYLTVVAAVVATIASFVLPGLSKNYKNVTQIKPSAIQLIDTLPKSDTLTKQADSMSIYKLESSKTTCCGKKSNYRLMKVKTGADNSMNTGKVEKDFNYHQMNLESGDSLSKINNENNRVTNENRIEDHKFIQASPADTIIKIDTIHIQKKGVQFKRKKDAF